MIKHREPPVILTTFYKKGLSLSIMEMKKLLRRFRQFGGMRLVWEYARLGVLGTGIKAFFRCAKNGESYKQIYPALMSEVEPFLRRKYLPVLQERKAAYENCPGAERKRNKILWYCWLQGVEQAPEIAKVCLASLRKHLPDREIRIIDANNWKDYAQLPDWLVRKWEKGLIPAANFSDLLRLELLIRHGGTWMDATILCTGEAAGGTPMSEYLDADLFLFQYTPPGTAEGISISNWFITSCAGNPVLMVLRDMLYAYWKEYDCTLDYYIFHLFFSMLALEYSAEVGAMPYGCSQRSIALMRHWGQPFRQEAWDRLTAKVSFHKLNYRVSDAIKNDKDNYYNHILRGI